MKKQNIEKKLPTRLQRTVPHHQHVQRVAIFTQCLWNEAIVKRIKDRGVQDAVQAVCMCMCGWVIS